MGGVMIVLPVVLITLLMNASSVIGVLRPGTLGHCCPCLSWYCMPFLGAVDDWEGLRGKRRGLGMRARTKFFFQWLLAMGTAWGLYYVLDVPHLYLPGFNNEIEMSPLLYIPIAAFIIVLLFECSESHRWLGWSGRFDYRNSICYLRRHCSFTRPGLYRSFLLHGGRCDLRVPMVQRAPSDAFSWVILDLWR